MNSTSRYPGSDHRCPRSLFFFSPIIRGVSPSKNIFASSLPQLFRTLSRHFQGN